MGRPTAIGTLAVLLAAAGADSRAQDLTPQPPAPRPTAPDILTAEIAESILGTSVEARSLSPLHCWYTQLGYFAPSGKNKSVRLALEYHEEPLADDYLAMKELYAEFPSQGVPVIELHDFADAALWIWKPAAGGTLYAFRGGTVQVEVTLAGLAEEASLAHAKSLAAQALGSADATGYAYLGTPEGDAAAAALAAAEPAAPTPAGSPQAAAPEALDAPAAPSPTTPPATPAADADFSDVPAALMQVADAAYITPAGILRELKEVSLSIEVTPALQAHISLDEARTDAIDALAAYGIQVVPKAEVMLSARVLHFSTECVWDGEIRHTHEFLLSLDFITNVAVRRSGAYHGLYAVVAGDRGQTSVWEPNETRRFFFGDELTPEIHQALPTLLHDVLGFIAANENVDTTPWYAADWTDEQKAAAGGAFVTAMRSLAPQESRCSGIDTAPTYLYQESVGDEYCAVPAGWRGQWTKGFEDLGWTKDAAAADCPVTLAHTYRCEYIDVINTPQYYRMMNIMQLKESNAVFPLNGRLVRKPIAIISWYKISTAFNGDELDAALFRIDDDVDEAIDAIKAAMK